MQLKPDEIFCVYDHARMLEFGENQCSADCIVDSLVMQNWQPQNRSSEKQVQNVLSNGGSCPVGAREEHT